MLVAATLVAELGSQQQKEQLLPAIAAGEKLVSLALQESKHHAPEKTAATAEKDGDGYALNGNKVMVLDASSADAFIVIARTGGSAGDGQVSGMGRAVQTVGIDLWLIEAGAG